MSASDAVTEWFDKALTAAFELPDGWFGRPYDNMHRLTWLAERDNKLIVELDGQLHLILSDPEVVASDRGAFELRCSQVVFDWRSYGSEGSRDARVFSEGGRVCFHASGM